MCLTCCRFFFWPGCCYILSSQRWDSLLFGHMRPRWCDIIPNNEARDCHLCVPRKKTSKHFEPYLSWNYHENRGDMDRMRWIENGKKKTVPSSYIITVLTIKFNKSLFFFYSFTHCHFSFFGSSRRLLDGYTYRLRRASMNVC
jgi:hypothetical protein